MGVDAAKKCSDAHEITDANAADEQIMDLYNNHVGRSIGADAANSREHSAFEKFVRFATGVSGGPDPYYIRDVGVMADEAYKAVDSGRTLNHPIQIEQPVSGTNLPQEYENK
jgi:hypothetical protein